MLLNCTLSGEIRSDDVQWYRTTNTTKIVHLGSDRHDDSISITISTKNNLTHATLLCRNVTKSIAGYYWIRLSSNNVCNTSVTVQSM